MFIYLVSLYPNYGITSGHVTDIFNNYNLMSCLLFWCALFPVMEVTVWRTGHFLSTWKSFSRTQCRTLPRMPSSRRLRAGSAAQLRGTAVPSWTEHPESKSEQCLIRHWTVQWLVWWSLSPAFWASVGCSNITQRWLLICNVYYYGPYDNYSLADRCLQNRICWHVQKKSIIHHATNLHRTQSRWKNTSPVSYLYAIT